MAQLSQVAGNTSSTHLPGKAESGNAQLEEHKTDQQPIRPDIENSRPAIILRWFINVVGLVAAIIFGVFSVLAWQVATQQSDSSDAQSSMVSAQAAAASEQANTANLLAFAILCTQGQQNSTRLERICNDFTTRAIPLLNRTLESLLPEPTMSSTSVPSGGSGGAGSLSDGAQIGIGVGVAALFVIATVTYLTWAKERIRSRTRGPSFRFSGF